MKCYLVAERGLEGNVVGRGQVASHPICEDRAESRIKSKVLRGMTTGWQALLKEEIE